MYRTTVTVEGMACSMCEAHINEVIRNSMKVKKVSSSRRKKITEITSEEKLDHDLIRKVITGIGYDVKDITETLR